MQWRFCTNGARCCPWLTRGDNAMSKPWMPWYVADFVADTQHLDSSLTGAYMLLIGHYWLRGGLPDDDASLSRIARMSTNEWRKAKTKIQAFFFDGWRHKRIDEELAHAVDISNKRRAAVQQREINRSSIDDQKITQSHPQSHLQENEVSNFSKGGGKKTNGWSPPRHGAQSTKFGTSYVLRSSEEGGASADDYRSHNGGRDPPGGEKGGAW